MICASCAAELPETQAKLLAALTAYLAQYGPDGYTRTTFVDFVVANVLRPGDLGDWYKRRASALSKAFSASPRGTRRRTRPSPG